MVKSSSEAPRNLDKTEWIASYDLASSRMLKGLFWCNISEIQYMIIVDKKYSICINYQPNSYELFLIQ